MNDDVSYHNTGCGSIFYCVLIIQILTLNFNFK